MKERISASVNKDTVRKINVLLKRGTFRNRSHIIESAIDLLMKIEEKNGK